MSAGPASGRAGPRNAGRLPAGPSRLTSTSGLLGSQLRGGSGFWGGSGIEASGLFEVVAVRQYDWERVYDAEESIELLSTFSGHLSMADWQRDRLFGEIRRRLARRPDRSVRRHWGTVLHVAQRCEKR
jgi:hypothetical protein